MIWPAGLGGIRSVVETYARDGFLDAETILSVPSYAEGHFVLRQLVFLRALSTCCRHFATKRVELVHLHAAMRGSFWRKAAFASMARLFGVPVLFHLHGSEMKIFHARQPRLLRWMIRRQLELATRVLVLSQSWREFVAEIAPGANIAVVPNYVAMPAVGMKEGGGRSLLFLGAVGKRKGTFDLIDAFAGIAADFPDARLTIAGNGQVEEAGLLVRAHGLEQRVTLSGWVEGEAKAELLRASDILVLPSYNEGLPMSVLEAMAAEIAVITTRVGGLPELLSDGIDGLLIAPGDRFALANAMARLLGDESLRRRIAEAGRRRVEQAYSRDMVLPLLHRLYSETSRSG